MEKTHVRSARDLRNNYREIANLVKNDHDHVIITSQGRGDIVLIDYEMYPRFEEFLHERYIAEKLNEGVLRMNAPDVEWFSDEAVLSGARERVRNRNS